MAPNDVSRVALPFTIGRRTLASVHRKLVRVPVPLAAALSGEPIDLPALDAGADGFYVRALPDDQVAALVRRSGLRAVVRQSYPRHYADLALGFDRYLAGFSAKSRSGLKRKLRRLEERSGGALDIRCYRRSDAMAAFHRHARQVSALTYQERLLDAGLPDDLLPELEALAKDDRVRAWLLFMDGRPVSYLHAPGEGDTLRYAHLGYDPAFADLSVGSLLQLEAMRMLMAEGRFRWFDFTEGDGQHKRQFATGAVASVDLLLLRPGFGNCAAVAALNGFDAAVGLAKTIRNRGLGLQRGSAARNRSRHRALTS